MPYRSVEYPNLDDGTTVNALGRLPARSLASGLLELITDAYSSQFEGEGRPLPTRTFENRYGRRRLTPPDDLRRLSWFEDTVVDGVYNRAGAYYAISESTRGLHTVHASLKVLPGESVESRFAGYAGIAEVLVAPHLQGLSYGAALLHAYLAHGVEPGQRVMLDAFDASNDSVNTWYDRLGFQREQPSGALKLSPEHKLPTTYWVSEPGLTAGAIANRLVAAHPELVDSRPLAQPYVP